MSSAQFARVSLSADTQSFQAFIGEFRKLWANELFCRLREDADELPFQEPGDFEAYDAALRQLPSHQFFAWLEHNLQNMKYSGRWGIVQAANAQREKLEAMIAAPVKGDMLEIHPDLEIPDYYLENDFHQHPGGLREDPIAAVIYRESASSTGGVVGNADLHALYVDTALKGRRARRVLDVGCGYGRSTFAFASRSTETTAVGVDLSQSCVRLSAHLAEGRPEAGRVKFVQADGVEVPFDNGSFDVFSSVMLLHEMPAVAIRELIAESFRVLEPRGIAAHLDFLPPENNFLHSLYLGHSDRNAEPFMRELAQMDLIAEHEAAGFTDVRIEAFAESPRVSTDRWRLPWTIIRATKPVSA